MVGLMMVSALVASSPRVLAVDAAGQAALIELGGGLQLRVDGKPVGARLPRSLFPAGDSARWGVASSGALVASVAGRALAVVDALTGKRLWQAELEAWGAPTFSPDGASLVVPDSRRGITTYAARTGKRQRVFESDDWAVPRRVAFAPGGHPVAVVCNTSTGDAFSNHTVFVLESVTTSAAPFGVLFGHRDGVLGLRWVSAGELATIDGDGTLRLFTAEGLLTREVAGLALFSRSGLTGFDVRGRLELAAFALGDGAVWSYRASDGRLALVRPSGGAAPLGIWIDPKGTRARLVLADGTETAVDLAGPATGSKTVQASEPEKNGEPWLKAWRAIGYAGAGELEQASRDLEGAPATDARFAVAAAVVAISRDRVAAPLALERAGVHAGGLDGARAVLAVADLYAHGGLPGAAASLLEVWLATRERGRLAELDDPGRGVVMSLLDSYRSSDDYEHGDALLARALGLWPEDLELLRRASEWWRGPKARAAAEKLIARQPDVIDPWFTLESLLAEARDEAALRKLGADAAARFGPDNPRAKVLRERVASDLRSLQAKGR